MLQSSAAMRTQHRIPDCEGIADKHSNNALLVPIRVQKHLNGLRVVGDAHTSE